jgi:hypothetical protein
VVAVSFHVSNASRRRARCEQNMTHVSNASLDEVLGSGALARRLGDFAGMGSRGRRV